MASPLNPDQLVAALRAEGLIVHEVRDWRTHNRNHKGAWGPVNGIMLHHTVTSGTANTVDLCYDGHADLPGPLCHGVVDKNGEVWLVGNGRTNHAGGGDPDVLAAVVNESYRDRPPTTNEHQGSAGAVDGNVHFYGFECINLGDGKDPWPAAQIQAMVKAPAAVIRAHRAKGDQWGLVGKSLIGHLEWSDWKSDPKGAGVAMPALRTHIAACLTKKPGEWRLATTPAPVPQQEDTVALSDDDIKKVARQVITGGNGMKSPDDPTIEWAVSGYLPLTYRKIREVGAGLDALAAKVDALSVGGVDLDALAVKVADLLAARLAE
jgi:hypothetical protein